jgi:seryl-tRNA synthetase
VLKAEKNKNSKTKPTLEMIEKMKVVGNEIKALDGQIKETEEKLKEKLWKLPNTPFYDVPIGGDEKTNVILRKVGKIPKFNFQPKDHLEIGETLNLLNTERAVKLSGSRFGYLKREAAILEFALVQFIIEKAVKEGFIPIVPPVLIKPEIMKGMGYIDTPEDLAERYYLEKDQLFLVGSSEQSIGGLHAGETFEESELPNRVIAFSTCFRKEAGSYGKDTRGILRVHQFDKVELFSFCHPDKSKEEHKFLISFEEKLWQALKIPYQLVQLSTGDMSRPSASTMDIEAWLPSQSTYREVSSASNTTDFQARRLNIRYKTKSGKPEFLHMLNATGFPIGRTIIAILENFQQKDGGVKIPKVLHKYTGFKIIKPPKLQK